MAGVEVVASYEWRDTAIETMDNNFGTSTTPTNVRHLEKNNLPKNIDFIVGSPPCTQFSFANRGGSGDIKEGLNDIRKFLEIVETLKPKYWAMENVPRVKNILEHEMKSGGTLEKYKNLVSVLEIIDISEYGLPQRRRRAIVGNFPIELFRSYKGIIESPSLGSVLSALQTDPVIDPNYPIQIPRSELTDDDFERPFDKEELRINRSAKEYHTVYNKMSFPDRLDTVSRTITATCTRVSRESVVIPNSEGGYRRLSIRERAVLQGFPVTYQFYGDSYSDKIKMIGNAIPPILAYLIGCSMLGKPSNGSNPMKQTAYVHPLPAHKSNRIQPGTHGKRYPRNRMFRFAIPNLRFGSGVRFQLSNNIGNDPTRWQVCYFYGTPKKILEIALSECLFQECISMMGRRNPSVVLEKGESTLNDIKGKDLQSVWIHEGTGKSPIDVLDLLGDMAKEIHGLALKNDRENIVDFVLAKYLEQGNGTLNNGLGLKYEDNAHWIFSGFLVGSWFNMRLGDSRRTG